MLAAQAEAAGCEARPLRGHAGRSRARSPPRSARPPRRRDLVIVIAGSSAGRDDYTAAVVAEAAGTLAVHGVAVRPGHPVVLGAVPARRPGDTRTRRPGYPVSAALTFDIFAAPLLAAARGRAAAASARRTGPAGPQARLDHGHGRLGPGAARARRRRARGHAAARAAPACSPRSCAPTACSSCPAGLEGHHAGEQVVGASCCAASARSSARSSRSARTTSCSTSPPPRCARPTRGSRWRRRTSARSAGWSRCATGCATWPARICSTRRPASTRCRTSTGCCAGRDVAVVRLVHRDQGLIVAPGNPLGIDGHRRPDRARPALRQPPARRRHPVLLDHELGAARRRPGRDRRLRARGAHPPRGRRGGRGGPRRLRPRHARRGARVRPRLRAGGAASPTTSSSRPALEDLELAPLWTLLESDDFRARGRGARRLRHRRDGAADPLTRVLSAGSVHAAVAVAARWPTLGRPPRTARPAARARAPVRRPR